MVGLRYARRFARRGKKYWVAALCAASFATGHYLFGQDDSKSSDSLLSQYQQATKQLVTEAQLPSASRQSSTAAAHATKRQPAMPDTIVQPRPSQNSDAPVANDSPELQAKRRTSSRRVKPTEEPKKESSIAQVDPPARVDPPASPPASQAKAELDNQISAAEESKSLPTVTHIEVPRQPAPSPKPAEPRIEIIASMIAHTDSPRTSPPAAEAKPAQATQPLVIENPSIANTPFVVAKPLPLKAEVQPAPQPPPTQPVRPIINASRQVAVPLQQTTAVSPISAVDDEHLPPIVSPDSVPRPGTRKRPPNPAPPAAPVLRIELGPRQPAAQ